MPDDSQTTRVVIVGGGLAGLAAATALAERGLGVTLLESRPRLGGRASSILDRETNTPIDNCQHVSMGCCTNFRHFIETVGLAGCFRTEKELHFVGPDGSVNRFAATRLPAPLHLLRAFRKLSYLSRADLRAINRGLRALCRRPSPEEKSSSFLGWLKKQRQTENAITRFWHVVLVSALSETLDRIDIGHARKVFVDGFLASRHGWEVDIPTVPLDDLYGEGLRNWIAERGGEIRLQSGVKRVVIEDDHAVGVELTDGERVDADNVIVAVPWERIESLLPQELAAHPTMSRLSKMEAAPISSVHLWFDRPITLLPHAVFVDRFSQWMFNRTALQMGEQRDQTSYYQVVISASREVTETTQAATINRVVAELADVWPATNSAALLHARVITEHRAVFSVLPGIDELRPDQQTPIANLQWAGDWTDTGWPATMEGAVRSGYLAAENVLTHLGRAESVLQPDLPVALLSKLLLRL